MTLIELNAFLAQDPSYVAVDCVEVVIDGFNTYEYLNAPANNYLVLLPTIVDGALKCVLKNMDYAAV